MCAVVLKCVAPTPGQRAGARPAALAERAERACEASSTTSKTGSAALDQSEGSCWWARQARFELRLRAAASAAARHTEPPLGRGSRHAPNKPVYLLRRGRGTVVAFLFILRSGH